MLAPPSNDTAILLPSAEATARLAARLARGLRPGDVVLLHGPVGAGKSHLARATIRSLLPAGQRRIDIPSPSYTLVQVYDSVAGPIWHADLYRLSDPSEVQELGLAEAFETAVCMVEWPDRLGALTPADALGLYLMPGDDADARVLRVSGSGPRSRALAATLCPARGGDG